MEAETSSPIQGLQCLNPAISAENFASNDMPTEWEIIQAHVHQRHMDRWIYRHDLIENRCWKNQSDSSHPLMMKECGTCNSCPSSTHSHFRLSLELCLGRYSIYSRPIRLPKQRRMQRKTTHPSRYRPFETAWVPLL